MDYEFDVIKYVENYLSKQNGNYKMYDPPVWEYLVGTEVKSWLLNEDVPSMIFIYFTALDVSSGGIYYKMYYQLVIGCHGVEIYYQNQNVIDRNRNHPLSDVKLRFTNWCKHMLKKLDN